MVDELGDLGWDPPVLPGVITVTNPTSVKRFASIHLYTLNVPEAAEGCWTGWVGRLQGSSRRAVRLNAGFQMPARSAGCFAECRRARNR